MKVQRQFADPKKTREVRVVDEKTGQAYMKTEPVCTHLKIVRGFVTAGISEGWLDIANGKLTLKAEPEDVVYDLINEPRYFCKSTGETIPISRLAWEAFIGSGVGTLSSKEAGAWLAANDKPDGDYDISMAYECELNDEQHERLRAVRDAGGNVVSAQAAAELERKASILQAAGKDIKALAAAGA
jgi:hypothetical protein